MKQPVRVGLAGAGPWARMVHAQGIDKSDDLALAGIWARRPEAARELAEPLGAPVFERIEDLFDASEAIAFSVPPAVQAELAVRAAEGGKSVLLEKPIAGDVAGAERLASAVDEAQVASMIVLSWRYALPIRTFLEESRTAGAHGGRGWFISGAFLGGPFATPWRLERGPLLDLGPHVIDLLDAGLGRVTRVQAHGDVREWVGLLLDHEGGAHSEVSLCATAKINPHLAGIELAGHDGVRALDCVASADVAVFQLLYREFAAAVRGEGGNGLDVHRGVHLQRIIEEAERQLLR